LVVTAQRHLSVFHEPLEVGGVAAGHVNCSPGRLESFGGVLAQGLQHPVPTGWARFDDHHRPFHQPADGVEHLAGNCAHVSHHVFGGHQRPAPLEH
jgi:hypothetical protein